MKNENKNQTAEYGTPSNPCKPLSLDHRAPKHLSDIAGEARSILSKLTDGETPKDYNWFGCETDTELVAEIKATARGEKINLTPSTLPRVIDIMYFG